MYLYILQLLLWENYDSLGSKYFIFLDFCLKSLVILKAIEEGCAKERVG